MNKRKSKNKLNGWTWSVTSMLLAMLILSGCGSKSGGSIVEGKVNVITTFYPIYEFTKEIGGDEVNVVNLLPTGVEPHDWTPRSQDIVNTSKAELFLYNGAGLEGWAPGFLKGLDKDTQVKPVIVSQGIQLIDAVGMMATGMVKQPMKRNTTTVMKKALKRTTTAMRKAPKKIMLAMITRKRQPRRTRILIIRIRILG